MKQKIYNFLKEIFKKDKNISDIQDNIVYIRLVSFFVGFILGITIFSYFLMA